MQPGGSSAVGPDSEGGRAIDLVRLQREVAAVDPAAALAPTRILRRVIRRDLGLTFGGAVTRQTAYAAPGPVVASVVAAEELGRAPGSAWPATVLLVAEPEAEELAGLGDAEALRVVWRRLVRARVLAAVGRAFEGGTIRPEGLAGRIATVGTVEFAEARAVLTRDGLLPADADDRAAYRAFAACYLELCWFAPGLRAHAFPALEDPEAVVEVLEADAGGPGLPAACRPPGLPAPVGPPAPGSASSGIDANGPADGTAAVGPAWRSASGRAGRLQGRARRAAERGNLVRAAVLRTEAALASGPGGGEADRASARGALKQLARRLQKALGLRKGEAEPWAQALAPLLKRASRGFWRAEARLLYDLQTVCDDHEREVYRLDPLGWALTLGRRPLKTPLPLLREVTVSNHLRRAAGRLAKVRVSREERARLDGLLRPAVGRAEAALRARFRPRVDAVLAATWVRPAGLPERVAYAKFVEELLDGIAGRGFSTLGDLRDAASRGNLKLPDLGGPAEFLRGDRLLAADAALATALDGVHRRGEVYLRWLQRFSALAFGTPLGRFLTLYVALPFGGSFVLLEGLQHLAGFVAEHAFGVRLDLIGPATVLVLGSVALGAINYVRFRREFLGVVRLLARGLRAAFIDLPALVLRNALLRRVLAGPEAAAVWRLVLKPGLGAGALWLTARRLGTGTWGADLAGLGGFFVAGFLLNTRAGRAFEEVAAEAVTRAGRAFAFNFLPGIFHLVMSAFERVLEGVERLIYAVDEWLRFRAGQSRGRLAAKAVLGLVWAVVAYLVRICVVILIEPQVNPIKHFPVVTVSHKVLLSFSPPLMKVSAAVLAPLIGHWAANLVFAATLLVLPGVFGFLVWELKANWRLYEANRPEDLGPVAVGGHGETVAGLLRPGFHSGVLPKLYTRLRRAERLTRGGGRVQGKLDALHHDEAAVRRFVDRELAALLRESRALGGPGSGSGVAAGEIRLATNRIRVELLRGDGRSPGLWFDLVECRGLLCGGVSRPGWLAGLDDGGRHALGLALAGFFKISGVDRLTNPGDPSATDFGGVVLPWRVWVAAWEAERCPTRSPGEGVPAPGVLPDPSAYAPA